MSDTTDKGKTTGRKPLTVSRGSGSGTVKQTFSHGRSKQVVVETKKRRTVGAQTKPSAAKPAAKKGAAAGKPQSKLAAAAAKLGITEEELLQRQKVLPLSQKVLQGMRLEYNAMQIGVFDLLAAKRDQLAAGIAYVQAAEDYWKTRANYEYLLAGGSPEFSAGAMPDMGMDSSLNDGGH